MNTLMKYINMNKLYMYMHNQYMRFIYYIYNDMHILNFLFKFLLKIMKQQK